MSIFIYEKGKLYTDRTGLRESQHTGKLWFVPTKKCHVYQNKIAIATLGSEIDWSKYEDFFIKLSTALSAVEYVPSVGIKLTLPTEELITTRFLIMTKHKLYVVRTDEDKTELSPTVNLHAVIDDGHPVVLSSENTSANVLISLGYDAIMILQYVMHYGDTITKMGHVIINQAELDAFPDPNAPVKKPRAKRITKPKEKSYVPIPEIPAAETQVAEGSTDRDGCA